jgi:hypothetical protein
MTFPRTRLATLVVGLCCFFLLTSQGPSPCAGLAKEIADLKADRVALQNDMKKASPGQKSATAGQIAKINGQIVAKEKQLEKCQCSGPLDGKFKLPFDNDSGWALCNGNWDDPINGHGKGEKDGEKSGQAYAFDFVYSPSHNCHGTEGHNVRAMRAGTVIASASDRTCNIWNLKKGDPCYGKPGEGNYILVRHDDNTLAAYCHLQKGKVFVKTGDKVPQGKVMALSGNTGNSSTPHVHVDVRSFWNSPSDMGPTQPVRFQDQNHVCWRPKVGDTLASNNN